AVARYDHALHVLSIRPPPPPPLFPYTTLFRSARPRPPLPRQGVVHHAPGERRIDHRFVEPPPPRAADDEVGGEIQRQAPFGCVRSEEHTSELQSRENLVCRLLLEKKKKRREQK